MVPDFDLVFWSFISYYRKRNKKVKGYSLSFLCSSRPNGISLPFKLLSRKRLIQCKKKKKKKEKKRKEKLGGAGPRCVRRIQGLNCQYKEEGHVSNPTLFVSMCQPMHGTSCPKSQATQAYILDCKIWKLFRPHGNGQKKTKCGLSKI